MRIIIKDYETEEELLNTGNILFEEAPNVNDIFSFNETCFEDNELNKNLEDKEFTVISKNIIIKKSNLGGYYNELILEVLGR